MLNGLYIQLTRLEIQNSPIQKDSFHTLLYIITIQIIVIINILH